MATQTDTLPAPDSVSANQINWNNLAVQIGAGLLAGEGPAYLRNLSLQEPPSSTLVATDDSPTGGASGTGPHLSDTWEQSSVALTLTIGTHVVTLPGPNAASGIDSSDDSEPYFFVYDSATWTASGMPAALAALVADDTLSITLTLDDGSAPVAPLFSDDTGDAQSWVTGTAIADLAVPQATGNPTPTYAVVGSLPDGLDFDTATRVISGTPTATGTGTITIRATNSEGTGDWTVTYSITAPPTVEVNISGPSTVNEDTDATLTAVVGGTATGDATFAWSVESGPGSITGAGASVTYEAPMDVASDTDVTVRVTVTRQGVMATADFDLTVSDVVVPTLTVTITGANRVEEGGSIPLTATIGGTATGDTTFAWEVLSGGGAVTGSGASVTYEAPADVLSDTDVTVRVTVTREMQTATANHTILVTTPTAPEFADNTGTAQSWTAGLVIATVTVPEATGTPVPTYAVVGVLPDGLQFDATTREITGTPTQSGSGTITIRATNAEGADDWTVAFSTAATPAIDELSVAIGGQASVGPGESLTLAAVRGGTLRGAGTYAWEILMGGDGTLTGTGSSVTYEAPMTISTEATVTVRVTLTVGTSTATDDFAITLRTAAEDTLTVTIRGNPRVIAGDDVALFVEVGGTAVGAITYGWVRAGELRQHPGRRPGRPVPVDLLHGGGRGRRHQGRGHARGHHDVRGLRDRGDRRVRRGPGRRRARGADPLRRPPPAHGTHLPGRRQRPGAGAAHHRSHRWPVPLLGRHHPPGGAAAHRRRQDPRGAAPGVPDRSPGVPGVHRRGEGPAPRPEHGPDSHPPDRAE